MYWRRHYKLSQRDPSLPSPPPGGLLSRDDTVGGGAAGIEGSNHSREFLMTFGGQKVIGKKRCEAFILYQDLFYESVIGSVVPDSTFYRRKVLLALSGMDARDLPKIINEPNPTKDFNDELVLDKKLDKPPAFLHIFCEL